MDASVENKPFAWQPLTPRGVAAFAGTSLGRVLGVQFVFAMLAAAAVVWFLRTDWFPTIRDAIGQLPAQGAIRSGRLEWAGDSPRRLAEGRFLAFAVDLKHEGEARSPAHLQVEFGQTGLEVRSLLGFVPWTYPPGWNVPFTRQELNPWWGAWAPEILAVVAGLVMAGLMVIWTVLATVYCLPVWLVGFFANRDLNWRGSWRVAGAALMPGALVMTAAIVLYGLGALDLVRLAAAGAAHFVIGWVYLFLSPLRLPLHPAATVATGNPFVKP